MQQGTRQSSRAFGNAHLWRQNPLSLETIHSGIMWTPKLQSSLESVTSSNVSQIIFVLLHFYSTFPLRLSSTSFFLFFSFRVWSILTNGFARWRFSTTSSFCFFQITLSLLLCVFRSSSFGGKAHRLRRFFKQRMLSLLPVGVEKGRCHWKGKKRCSINSSIQFGLRFDKWFLKSMEGIEKPNLFQWDRSVKVQVISLFVWLKCCRPPKGQ